MWENMSFNQNLFVIKDYTRDYSDKTTFIHHVWKGLVIPWLKKILKVLGHFRGTTIGYNISKLNCAKGRIYSSFVTMEHSPKL